MAVIAATCPAVARVVMLSASRQSAPSGVGEESRGVVVLLSVGHQAPGRLHPVRALFARGLASVAPQQRQYASPISRRRPWGS
jgi:hypothetical protein